MRHGTDGLHPGAAQTLHANRRAFTNSSVSMGVMIHMAGLVIGALATDKMRDPSARWATIAAFGVATGIGETIWRDHIVREQAEREERLSESPTRRF